MRKRLLNDPKSLRQIFIDDGTQAIVWEFKQDELGADFTKTLWNLLLRDDDMSTILQRFIWAVPLKFKRKFIAALDAHLSDRYPMFKGLSENWPAQNFIPPYVRPAEERKNDFELVTMGYLGYRDPGLHPARSRPARLARSAARQAVRRPSVRSRRVRRQGPQAAAARW